MSKFIKEELSGWKAWEASWLGIACLVILILSVYWHDTPIGIISAITGVACVVCTGKGKLSAYIFGTVNVLLYALISFQAKYYGEVMLNLLYYFPMEFYGFYVWKKHMNEETHEVEKRSMSPKGLVLMLLLTAAATVAYTEQRMDLYYEKIKTLMSDYQDLILENQMVLEELEQECQDKINENMAYALQYMDAYDYRMHIGHLKKEMNNVILIYGLCDMVHRAMTLVKYFTPNFGEEYYDVLYGCYCRSRKAADVDIMIELGMSRATFYRKKKAALRYLGYYFFEIVVPQSANKRYKPSFPVEGE